MKHRVFTVYCTSLLCLPCMSAQADLFEFANQLKKTNKSNGNNTASQNTQYLGIIVNNKEITSYSVINENKQFYIPVKKLPEWFGITYAKNQQMPPTTNVADSKQTKEEATKQNTKKATQNPSLENTLKLSTPIGQAGIAYETLLTRDNSLHIAINDLKKVGVVAEYDPKKVALTFYLSWQPNDKPNATTTKTELIPNYKPKSVGVLKTNLQTGLQSSQSNKLSQNQSNTKLSALGYAKNGIWGLTLSNNQDQTGSLNTSSLLSLFYDKAQIDNLYWRTANENYALRIGTNQSNNAEGNTYTGFNLGYSNRNIKRFITAADANTSSLLSASQDDYQHIRGSGPAGGIAELRINGIGIARITIPLNQKFEFTNLNINKLATNTARFEVALYEHALASQPISVKALSLGKRTTQVATDELLIEAGIGFLGNAFIDKEDAYLATFFAEYGVSNRFVINASASYHHKQDESFLPWHVGMHYVTSPASHLGINFYQQENSHIAQLAWQLQKPKWHIGYQLDYSHRNKQNNVSEPITTNNTEKVASQTVEQLNNNMLEASDAETLLYSNELLANNLFLDNNTSNNSYLESNATGSNVLANTENNLLNSSNNVLSHAISLGYQLTDTTAINATINHTKPAHEPTKAAVALNTKLTPSITSRLSWLYPSNNYLLDVAWQNILPSVSISAASNNSTNKISTQHQLNEKTSLNNALVYDKEFSGYMQLVTLTHHFASHNKINASYMFAQDFGWQLGWHYHASNAWQLATGYQRNFYTEYNEQPEKNSRFFIQLRTNGWFSPDNSFYLGDYPLNDKGSILVNMNHPDSLQTPKDSLKFTLNDNAVTSKLLTQERTNSQYIINNLPPGNHTLALANSSLPFGYSVAQNIQPVVSVAAYAPTEVPITVAKTYGVTGKLELEEANLPLQLSQNGKTVAKTTSQHYGYFQFHGLPAGSYTLAAAGYRSKDITIQNSTMMNVKLSSLTPTQE